MAESIGVHVVIKGRVQGVGYRAWLAREAAQAQVSGWCRNLPTGEVEAVLCGASAAVQRVLDACRHGPSWANVIAVDVVSNAEPVMDGFSVRDTA